jgi:hypothetical protein
MVLVSVVALVVCVDVLGVPVLPESYVLRVKLGKWGSALRRGCGVVVLGVVGVIGRNVDADVDIGVVAVVGADVDIGVGADVDVGARWVGMDMWVGCVDGIFGVVSVVVAAASGCFVDVVVGGVFWCHSLSGFLTSRGPWFFLAISCSPKLGLIHSDFSRSSYLPCLVPIGPIVVPLYMFPLY